MYQPTTYSRRMHRYALPVCFACLLSITLGIMSCTKTERTASNTQNPASSHAFDAAAAKEWYYATFKKSSDWSAYDRIHRGGQLPDWRHGSYRTTGASEIAEFPLIKARASILIPQDAVQNPTNRTRIAEATQFRVEFIKPKNSVISVRLITLVPDLNYLTTKGFDLSSVHLHDAANDFSGRVYITTWDGTPVSAWILRKGKFLKQINVAAHRTPSPQANECGSVYTIFERECTELWVGENLASKDCGDWLPIDQWFVPEPCDGGNDPCSDDMNSSACQCAMYGCNGSPGSPGQDCAEQFEAHKMDLPNSAEVTSEFISAEIVPIDNLTKWKNPVWKCLKSPGNTWSLYSHEEGQVELIDVPTNKWQWKSLEHKSITLQGMPIGGTVEPDNGIGTPSFTAGTPNILYAGMSVSYTVKYTAVCDCPGINAFSYTGSYTSTAIFDAKP